ncbi:CNBP [Mytilus edulis]|uniref:CNBP n=1 Tax=Mytilus edulis TaxID=6550 RepID=A0A8S3SZC6_MYTED|nr:CNBP [Mytilus edulis]
MADGETIPKTQTKTYAEIASSEDTSSKDQSVSDVKPIFIMEDDLFGSSKPTRDQYLTHVELYKAVECLVDPSHLKGLQRVRGMWRLYFDNHEDREKMLTNGIVIRKKLIQTYARNPMVANNENPSNIWVRVKNIPCSADDGQIQRALEEKNCIVHKINRERLRVDGRLTNCQTGDRFAICDPIPTPLPKTLQIGKYRAIVLHKGQEDTQKTIKCNKCLQEGHKLFECPNDWVCRTCGGSGHKSNYCTTCPNDWLCQTCGKSGHTAQYCNADTVSSSEDSQSESDSDSDNKSSHQENGNYNKPQSPDLSNSKNRFTFNKQISETVEKQDSNNQNNQSKENPKASDTNSTDEKRQKTEENLQILEELYQSGMTSKGKSSESFHKEAETKTGLQLQVIKVYQSPDFPEITEVTNDNPAETNEPAGPPDMPMEEQQPPSPVNISNQKSFVGYVELYTIQMLTLRATGFSVLKKVVVGGYIVDAYCQRRPRFDQEEMMMRQEVRKYLSNISKCHMSMNNEPLDPVLHFNKQTGRENKPPITL